MMTADEIIRILQLQPHPKEQGYFVESYRSKDKLSWESLPDCYGSSRAYGTAIYFLLKREAFSEMHRLKSDEIFHFYYGDPAELLILSPEGSGTIRRLGPNLNQGETPQIVVPKYHWQGMQTTGEFTLMGCTVAPGFEYSDYESGQRADLISKYPEFSGLIRKLTRE